MLESPAKNKMMQAPPAKKGWHFSGSGIYVPAYIEAKSIEEATEIYHKTKRLISDAASAVAKTPAAADIAPEQSTASSASTDPQEGVK